MDGIVSQNISDFQYFLNTQSFTKGITEKPTLICQFLFHIILLKLTSLNIYVNFNKAKSK